MGKEIDIHWDKVKDFYENSTKKLPFLLTRVD